MYSPGLSIIGLSSLRSQLEDVQAEPLPFTRCFFPVAIVPVLVLCLRLATKVSKSALPVTLVPGNQGHQQSGIDTCSYVSMQTLLTIPLVLPSPLHPHDFNISTSKEAIPTVLASLLLLNSNEIDGGIISTLFRSSHTNSNCSQTHWTLHLYIYH